LKKIKETGGMLRVNFYRPSIRKPAITEKEKIIAVGFKVNNQHIVKDYTVRAGGMDENRLKNGGSILTEEYF
jgi:hypothetical protein